jgi:small subunit ribosomal protein S20
VARRHLSVEKRARQNAVRNRRNRTIKSAVRGALKQAIENTDQAKAAEVTVEAQRMLDKAVARKIVHKNKASRVKSQLMKKLNKAPAAKTA